MTYSTRRVCRGLCHVSSNKEARSEKACAYEDAALPFNISSLEWKQTEWTESEIAQAIVWRVRIGSTASATENCSARNISMFLTFLEACASLAML